MNYPRLYTGGTFSKTITPVSVSITQNITPLSTATITMQMGETLPPRSYLELFTPYGSAGFFRVRSPHDSYGQATTTADLEHMISEVGDYIIHEEISEMMDPQAAVKKIFKYYDGGLWRLGDITALGSIKVACDFSYERVLDCILAILEQKPTCMMTFDFSKKPWRINIAKKGTVVQAEGRLARNLRSATVTSDDTELVTRVWYQTFDKDKNPTWTHKDADTLKTYGVIEGTVNTDSSMSSSEINQTVNTFIAEHKNPRISINIQADELSRITGESFDMFVVGNRYRITLPDYNRTVEETITSVSWADVYNDPRSVTVTLGTDEDTVVTFLHNLETTGSGGSGGGKSSAQKNESKWKQYDVEWKKLDDSLVGTVKKMDKTGSILEQAGLTLNSKGLLVYAKTENGLKSQFNVLSNKITSEVSHAVNGTTSKITQTANAIRAEVKSTKLGLESKITQTAGQIRTELQNTATGLESSIMQTASQIRTEVSNTAAGLQSSITQESNRISLVVEGTGENAHVKAASIVAGINEQSGSFVKISANKINLSGYVTATSLDAVEAKFDNLVAGNTTAAWIKANQGNIPKLTIGNDLTFKNKGVYWQGVTINGTAYHFMGYVG